VTTRVPHFWRLFAEGAMVASACPAGNLLLERLRPATGRPGTGDAARGEVSFAAFDVVAGALGHRRAGAGDVEDQRAAVTEQLEAIGNAVHEAAAAVSRAALVTGMGVKLASRSPAVTSCAQTSKMSGSVRKVSVLILAALANCGPVPSMAAKAGMRLKLATMAPGDAVDVAHALADLDVAAFVELLDRHRVKSRPNAATESRRNAASRSGRFTVSDG
jgi:hypothetical protein